MLWASILVLDDICVFCIYSHHETHTQNIDINRIVSICQGKHKIVQELKYMYSTQQKNIRRAYHSVGLLHKSLQHLTYLNYHSLVLPFYFVFTQC